MTFKRCTIILLINLSLSATCVLLISAGKSDIACIVAFMAGQITNTMMEKP